MFNLPKKQQDYEPKNTLNGKKLCQIDSVKSLGTHLD